MDYESTESIIRQQIAEEYWQNNLSGKVNKAALPIFSAEDGGQARAALSLGFPQYAWDRLEQASRGAGLSTYVLVLTSMLCLLHRYGMEEDIIIGTSCFRISEEDSAEGLLFLKNNISDTETFKEILGRVKNNVVNAYEYQEYPFAALAKKLKGLNDTNISDFFGIALVYEGLHEKSSEQDSFDLTVILRRKESSAELELEYNSGIYLRDTIESFGRQLIHFIEQALGNTNAQIRDIELLTPEDRMLLHMLNNTKTAFETDKLLQCHFEEQAQRVPDKTAVKCGKRELTYRELNQKANQLARTLRNKGIGPDSIVGIMLDRSIEMLIGILGVFKAGGAYLPIDAAYPPERISYMLGDSGAKVLLVNGKYQNTVFQYTNIEEINLEDEALYSGDSSNLQRLNGVNDLAYIIYTSGSTGKPKGAMVEQLGMLNHALAKIKDIELDENSIVSQNSSHCFDISVWQFLAALMVGGQVIIYPNETVMDVKNFVSSITQDGINVLEVVPTYLSAVLDQLEASKTRLEGLRYLLITGEALNKGLVERWYGSHSGTKLVNAYGPTEASDDITHFIMDRVCSYETIPIGKPIQNLTIYIVDNNMKLCPGGVMGEICVSGIGVGRGYINNEEKTRQAFMEDPFAGRTGIRLYKTGDLGRWLPDGNIEFFGRKDYQVKIRGFRIELGEIENKLLKHEGVKEAVVIDREYRGGEKYLCAYIVSDTLLDMSEIREYLSLSLPYYMVPSYFMQLERLPLTPNGKINRKALPEPEGKIMARPEYEAPASKLEEALAAIWSEVLGTENIGTNEDFFELGGHSLKAAAVISRIHRELNIEIPLKAMFEEPTIKALAKYMENMEQSIYSSIKPAEKREYYPVSSAQKRLYAIQEFDPEGVGYNMPFAAEIIGSLDKDRLEKTFDKLLERHESLRTSFEVVDGEIVQKVHEGGKLQIEYSQCEEAELQSRLDSFVKAFDLSKAPLLRVSIIKTEQDRHIFILDMHHIISDGLSISILIKEFTDIYDEKEPEALRLQYKDYCVWQAEAWGKEQTEGHGIKAQEDYWLEVFKNEAPVLNMSYDFERPSAQSFEGESIEFALGSELTESLNRLAKQTDSTMYMVLLSAYNILLSKYSGQEDIIIGSPIAGRPHGDLENIIGMFANTLAIRNYPQGDMLYSDFLRAVRSNALGAYENSDYPFDELLERLDIRRDMSRNPLFDAMFVFQNIDVMEIKVRDFSIKPYDVKNTTAKFDLLLSALEENGIVRLEMQYCTKLFKRESILRMIGHFRKILEIICGDREIALREIDMLTAEEKNQILLDFNDTEQEYPNTKTLQELFEMQVERTPDNIAVSFEDSSLIYGESLTYGELNEKANKVARVLRKKGVTRETIVGVLIDRSLEMMIAVMGILKAGAGCLPINIQYPDKRISYMLEDSGAEVLLTKKCFADKVPDREIVIIDIEDEELFRNESGENCSIINEPQDLYYVIYTSGTTGNPKGVMVGQRVIINLLYHNFLKTALHFKQKILQFSSISFDAFFFETNAALLSGGEVCLIREEVKNDVDALFGFISQRNIETLNLPAALVKFVFSSEEYSSKFPKCVKHMIATGEQLLISDLLKKFAKQNKLTIHNHYGPSETHVATTYTADCEDNIPSIPPIGKPVINSRVYILDSCGKIQPVGIPGELYIAGECLGIGYLKRPDMTKDRFIPDPFKPGERMYKTGDLARWLPDGSIDYLGRIDKQVKVRGFRVELGEIETQLMKIEDIKEAAVIAREDASKSKYVCAYIISDKELKISDIKKELARELPDYMVPAYIIQVSSIPKNANNKVDANLLPGPQEISIDEDYQAPENSMQQELAQIWENVLDVSRVSISSSFFDLGGHSLKAIELAAKIHKKLGVRISIKEIFDDPTIKGISRKLELKRDNTYAAIEKTDKREYYPVSSAQKRLYTLWELDRDGTAYNLPNILQVEGVPDIGRLERAFAELIKRHEALRTAFEIADGEIVQKIYDEVEFGIDYIEGGSRSAEEAVNGFTRAFDLSKAPLLRVGLVRLESDSHILLFDMHHIISDGVSMGILVREFMSLYDGVQLEELKLQYRDYCEWQRKLYESDAIKRQEEYWLDIFKGDASQGTSEELPQLNLPLDYPRPALQSFEGDMAVLELDCSLTEKLGRLARDCGATLYMVLLAAYNVLLSKHSGQEDIVVGSPTAGRPHADLEGIIGMFVNTLVMRNYPNGEKTFREFLREIKENALKAYENQDYQLEDLLEKLKKRSGAYVRDMSRNPLFDTMLVLQNMDIPTVEIGGLKLSPYNSRFTESKFDLTLRAEEAGDKINIGLEYCTKLFKRETIERFSAHFVNILSSIVENPDIRLKDIEILTEEEASHMLYDWNDTKAEYPHNKTIKELFEEQAESTPDNTAAVFDGKYLSYSELDKTANQLARTLRDNGVKADTIVGLMTENSLEMVIGLLGIVKAGGAYLPIDPRYPAERIEYMLKDGGCDVLLTHRQLADNIGFEGIIMDLEDEEIYQGDSSRLDTVSTPDSLIYVIYTSGTTGQSKGVMVENRGLTNYVSWFRQKAKLTEADKTMLVTSYAFDLGYTGLYSALLTGCELHIAPGAISLDPEELLRYLNHNKITYIKITPSLFNIMLNAESFDMPGILDLLRLVILGGEPVNTEDVEKFAAKYPESRLINHYGPTETTIGAAAQYICPDSLEQYKLHPSIGRPISNMQIYILDKYLKPVPIMAAGEIYICGAGVARGYLGKPELTAQRFVSNPFSTEQTSSNTAMYRTGDLARWLPDGTIEILGRADKQVKIRGYRVETAEIQSRLLTHEEVRDAIVVPRQDKFGKNYLCAYVAAETELDMPALRGFLARTLPEYMIPSYFIQLESLPVTLNGKLDMKALPEPGENIVSNAGYEAPSDIIEERIAQVWQEVLGLQRVGVNDHFFELGGDSIKAIQISARLRKWGYKLEIIEMMKNPTIRGLKDYVKEVNVKARQGIIEGDVQLTPIQKRFFDRSFASIHHYNQAAVLFSKEGFDREIIVKVFDKIIEHHDALRMIYRKLDDTITQYNRGMTQGIYSLREFELYDTQNAEADIQSKIDELNASMDIFNGSLVNLGLFRTGHGDHLFIGIHHLLVDGVSWRILFEDFALGYRQAAGNEEIAFSQKSSSYLDWSEALLEYSSNAALLKEIDYWSQMESKRIHRIPKDKECVRRLVKDSDVVFVKLDRHETELLLKDINKAYNTEINDILLTALSLTFREFAGMDSLLLELEGHGRQDISSEIDITRTMGWFTCVYPVMLENGQSEDIGYCIKSTKETIRHIPNKGIGYGILKYITSPELLGGLELSLRPELSFNYLGQFDGDVRADIFEMSSIAPGKIIDPESEAVYSIEIGGMVANGELLLSFTYNKNEYNRDTIQGLAELYKSKLLSIYDHCLAKEHSELTPSDLSDDTLTLEELDSILDDLEI